MDNLILVNKTHSIDIDYVPLDLVACDKDLTARRRYGAYLRKEPFEMVMKLRDAAKESNYDIYVSSGFRSGAEQQRIYARFRDQYIASLKERYPSIGMEKIIEEAEILTKLKVAKPGQSEHQTGLAMDIACFFNGNYDEDISNIYEVEWMHENAHKYGFILRYPKGSEEITGYRFEPWHYRYIGEEYATDFVKTGLTFEDYHSKILRLE